MINLNKLTDEELKEAVKESLDRHISIQEAIQNRLKRVQKVEP